MEIEINGVELPENSMRVATLVKKYGGVIAKDWYNAEIILPPARGAAFIEMVHEICDELVSAKPWFAHGDGGIFSGNHLHVDLRTLKFRHLGHIMVMYSKYEPLILQTQPYHRFQSKFCKPNGLDLGDGWEKAVNSTAQEAIFKTKAIQLTHHSENANRYKAVNFSAWYKYQTMEVRMHEGTASAEDIIAWASLWGNFVENTKDIPYKTAQKEVPTLESLRELVGPMGAEYLDKRMAMYKKQWTKERIEEFTVKKQECPWPQCLYNKFNMKKCVAHTVCTFWCEYHLMPAYAQFHKKFFAGAA